ncbi:hypothetical protein ACH40F_43400 [Streptomyces sp. NPDC020794]|uniref:hypothetical protein n=1 Tax=unclassified Streptomyces TaxID=2593676 RepID=UPI0036EBF139
MHMKAGLRDTRALIDARARLMARPTTRSVGWNLPYTQPNGRLMLRTVLRQEHAECTSVEVTDTGITLGGALTALLAHVRPTVVRTMDPDPEHDGGKEEYVCSDHVDHTAATHFALAALTRHREAGHTPVVEHYRAYANRFWGYNLDSAAVTEKAEYLATYAGLDAPQACPHGTCERCGDRQLGPNPFRSTHMRSAAYRYSPTTDWLRLGPDGRLNAFGVLAGRLAFWTETAPASGECKGPFVLGDGWLAPTLAVTGVPGGPAELVGLRRQSVVGSGVTVDVVHTVQDPDGNGFSGWRTLENPDWSHGDGRRQREVGVPSAAVDGMGRLHVFVRVFAQGISLRRRDTTGAWAPWEDLGGSFLQDAGTALTTENGTVELYVPGKNTVWRWYQPEPGGPFTLDDTLKTGRPATGGITAVDSGGGSTCLYYREAGTQQVMAYRQHADGRWPGSGAGLGGHGGYGRRGRAVGTRTRRPGGVPGPPGQPRPPRRVAARPRQGHLRHPLARVGRHVHPRLRDGPRRRGRGRPGGHRHRRTSARQAPAATGRGQPPGPLAMTAGPRIKVNR